MKKYCKIIQEILEVSKKKYCKIIQRASSKKVSNMYGSDMKHYNPVVIIINSVSHFFGALPKFSFLKALFKVKSKIGSSSMKM